MEPPAIDWSGLRHVPSLDGTRLEVRVMFPYDKDRNEQLRALNYRWNASGKYWTRSVMGDGFDLDAFREHAWAKAGVKIEVYSEAGEFIKRLQV